MRVENSFIGVRGVGEATERALWRAGITHWDDFDGSVVGEARAERVFGFIEAARDRLTAGDARYFADALPNGCHWRLFDNFHGGARYLDIETTGLGRGADVTTVSVHRDGATRTLVRGRDLTRAALRDELAGADLLVTFNGKTFDVPALERAFGLDVDAPHLDLRYPCAQLGLSGGLKGVERALGIERDRPDLSGRDAVRLWRRYERGDDAALETLVDYNRDDTEHLAPIAAAVADRLHDEVFEAARDDGP